MNRKINELLEFIYGSDQADEIIIRLESLIARRISRIKKPQNIKEEGLSLDQKDAFIIAGSDLFAKSGKSRLATLKDFISGEAAECISGVHILPVSPDLKGVDPEMGDWEDLSEILKSYKLMSGLVMDPARTGLDFEETDTILKLIDAFLFYVQKGVQVIRLNGVNRILDDGGQEQEIEQEIEQEGPGHQNRRSHAIVKLFRAIVDEYVPWVVITTETSIPHEDNISFFGDKRDEARMVSQFSLPPLVLDAFIRGKSSRLKSWAAELPHPDGKITFYNFLDPLGSIEMLPVKDILSGDEKNKLSETVKKRGGSVLNKTDSDTDSAFGLDINLCNALSEEKLSNEQRAGKFLAAESIIMSLPGIPGINIQNLIGACGKTETEYDSVINDLRTPSSLSYMIFEGCKKMLEARAGYQAFHPFAGFRLLESGDEVFGIERISEETGEKIVCIVNVSGNETEMEIPGKKMQDIISGKMVTAHSGKIALGPYGVSWLRIFD